MANLTLSDAALDVLERAAITASSVTLPDGRLDRQLYVEIDKVLKHAGGKWHRGKRSHLFTDDPRQTLVTVLESGLSVDEKKLFQVFYTPAAIARRMVELADVKARWVLEPSAGAGAIADACKAAGAADIQCVEIRPAACDVLRAKGYRVYERDFFDFECSTISRVVMNPPFTRGQDVKHIRHALKFTPVERLVSLRLGHDGAKGLEEFNPTIYPLPAGAFHESGTDVPTSIIVIDKRR